MGKRGPAPTPTKLLEARGSWLAKTRKREPKPDLCEDLPKPPRWLPKTSRTHWNAYGEEIMRLGVMAGIDRIALALLADALAEYTKAQREFHKQGFFHVSDKGARIQNPCVGAMHQARLHVLKLLQEFGLTPSSRARVEQIDTAHKEDKSSERFFKTSG